MTDPSLAPNTLDLWVGSTCSQSVNIFLSELYTNIPGASHRKYRHPWIELVFPLSYHWRCVVQLIRWPYLYGGSRKTVPPQNVAKQHQQFFDGAITKSCIKIHHSHGLKFHRSHLPAQQPEPHVPVYHKGWLGTNEEGPEWRRHPSRWWEWGMRNWICSISDISGLESWTTVSQHTCSMIPRQRELSDPPDCWVIPTALPHRHLGQGQQRRRDDCRASALTPQPWSEGQFWGPEMMASQPRTVFSASLQYKLWDASPQLD